MTFARQQTVSIPRRQSARHGDASTSASVRHVMPLTILGLAFASSAIASDWIAGLGIVVLGLVWFLLTEEKEAPVLPLAVTFQWLQVTCGVYYLALTGREVEAHYASDYRPMVLLGLGCVIALAVGLAVGLRAGRSLLKSSNDDTTFTVSWRTLMIAYIATTLANAVLREVAWSVPELTQGLVALGYVRLGVLFLMLRRLVRYQLRWEWFFGLVLFELMLGFTGYFAGFREPLILATVALLEVFRPRSLGHWLRIALVTILIGAAGLMWIGIRTVYRSEIDAGELTGSRVERLGRVARK